MNLTNRRFRQVSDHLRYPGVIAAPVVLIGLLSVAPADARPDPLPPPGPFVLPAGDYCDGFDVEVTFTKVKSKVVQDTTDLEGVQTVKITGNAQATVTNQDSGKSVDYNVSGPGTTVYYPDGAFSGDYKGPNLLWTTRANSFPGVPTISYTTGHVTFAVDATGRTTSYTLAGHQTDVCAALAS